MRDALGAVALPGNKILDREPSTFRLPHLQRIRSPFRNCFAQSALAHRSLHPRPAGHAQCRGPAPSLSSVELAARDRAPYQIRVPRRWTSQSRRFPWTSVQSSVNPVVILPSPGSCRTCRAQSAGSHPVSLLCQATCSSFHCPPGWIDQSITQRLAPHRAVADVCSGSASKHMIHDRPSAVLINLHPPVTEDHPPLAPPRLVSRSQQRPGQK